MNLRALVVDDEAPARHRLRRLLAHEPDVTCVGEAANGVAALSAIETLAPDVVFLDIDMPELSGIDVAAHVGPDGPAVVFVTAFDAHAVRAFELAAADYLLKPVDAARLRAAVARVRVRRLAGVTAGGLQRDSRAGAVDARLAPLTNSERRMAIRAGARYVVFETRAVAAVIATDHYTTFYVDGTELLSDEPLDRIEARLAGANFVRVHRSALVNLDAVRELVREGDRKFVLGLGEALPKIPVSRDRLEDVKSRLGVC